MQTGAFAGTQHDEKSVVVDKQPTRAGIDPYNKSIDRIADDHMIDVAQL